MRCTRGDRSRDYPLCGGVKAPGPTGKIPIRVWESALDVARSAVMDGRRGGRFGYLLDSVFVSADKRLDEMWKAAQMREREATL